MLLQVEIANGGAGELLGIPTGQGVCSVEAWHCCCSTLRSLSPCLLVSWGSNCCVAAFNSLGTPNLKHVPACSVQQPLIVYHTIIPCTGAWHTGTIAAGALDSIRVLYVLLNGCSSAAVCCIVAARRETPTDKRALITLVSRR